MKQFKIQIVKDKHQLTYFYKTNPLLEKSNIFYVVYKRKQFSRLGFILAFIYHLPEMIVFFSEESIKHYFWNQIGLFTNEEEAVNFIVESKNKSEKEEYYL